MQKVIDDFKSLHKQFKSVKNDKTKFQELDAEPESLVVITALKKHLISRDIEMSVTKPWYASFWFLSLIVGAVVIAIGAFLHFETRKSVSF